MLITANDNWLLSALAQAGDQLIFKYLLPTSLAVGQVLSTPSIPFRQAYFLTSGMACMVVNVRNGGTVATHLVGHEGFVGLPLLFGSDTFLNAMAVMETAGTALRITAGSFIEEMAKPGPLQALMRRYALAQLTGSMQTAACNRLHSIEERLACWLLMAADRVGPHFRLTHETIGNILGSRRATITTQAERFQQAGLATYRYGHIRIANRERLQRVSCECYKIHRKELEICFRS